MNTREGGDLTLPDRRFVKQEVTYQLVAFAEDEVYNNYNVKQEPPDDIDVEESQEITIKEECLSNEELIMDEYDTQDEEKHCTGENDNHLSKASTFTNSTSMSCETIMKPGLKKKRIVSCKTTSKAGKTSLTVSNRKARGSRYLQKGSFCSNTFSANIDFDETRLNKQEFLIDNAGEKINVSENISRNNSQKSSNVGASNKGYKNSTAPMLKNSQSQVIPKKYECNVCGKSYNHASNRTRHMRIHLQKRHVCELCAKSFSHIGALNEHKLHHMIGTQQFPKVQKVSCFSTEDAAKSRNPQIQSLSKSFALAQMQKNKVVSKKQITELPTSKTITSHMKVPKLSKLKATIGHRQTFPCNICGKNFSWHYLLKRHKQGHLTKHSIKNVAVKNKYPCVICKKTFSSKAHLIRHEGCETHKVQLNLIQSKLKETETSKYSCDVCNKIFSSSQNLRRHRETHIHKLNVNEILKETSEQKHTCDMCRKSFASQQLLKKHKLTHFNSHNKEKKMKGIIYTCQICKMSFFWLSEVKKHLSSAAHLSNVNHMKKKGQNGNDRAHSCNVCGKIFSRQQDLRRHHRNSGHELQKHNIACDTCGVKFLRETDLKEHQALVGHLPDSIKKPQENFKMVYSCEICGKTFPWSYQLNNHKISHMPKKYPCNICGKYFAAEYLLKKHKIVHSKRMTNLTSEKLPHVKVTVCTCNICGEKFAQLNRLRKHKAVCHRLHETFHPENKDSNSGATKFSLDEDKKFSLSIELLETGVLPIIAEAEKKPNVKLVHTCVICNKKFSRLRDLHIHRTKTGHVTLIPKQENENTNVSNESGFSCNICGKTFSRLSDLNRHKAMAGHNYQMYQTSYSESKNTYGIKTQYPSPDMKEQVMHNKLTPISTNKENENTKAYPCAACNKKFSRQSDLSRHRNKFGHFFQPEGTIKKALNSPQEQYSCGTCSKAFTRQNDLRRHVAVTGHAYEALISEKGNTKYFSSNKCSLSHSEDLHTWEQPAKSVTVAFSLQGSSKAYPCHTCGKTFPWQYLLKNHKCHGATKKYSCKICDKHFSQEYLLKRHKLLHASHSDKKIGQGAYTCNTCHRVFSRLSDLSRHSNLSGHVSNKSEPKFYCQFCNRFFWRLCDLKRHENKSGHHSYALNVQKKEPKNLNNKARKVVSQSNNVIKHSSIIGHSSNMTVAKQKANSKSIYQCKVCKRSYTWQSSLSKHKAATGHM